MRSACWQKSSRSGGPLSALRPLASADERRSPELAVPGPAPRRAGDPLGVSPRRLSNRQVAFPPRLADLLGKRREHDVVTDAHPERVGRGRWNRMRQPGRKNDQPARLDPDFDGIGIVLGFLLQLRLDNRGLRAWFMEDDAISARRRQHIIYPAQVVVGVMMGTVMGEFGAYVGPTSGDLEPAIIHAENVENLRRRRIEYLYELGELLELVQVLIGLPLLAGRQLRFFRRQIIETCHQIDIEAGADLVLEIVGPDVGRKELLWCNFLEHLPHPPIERPGRRWASPCLADPGCRTA